MYITAGLAWFQELQAEYRIRMYSCFGYSVAKIILQDNYFVDICSQNLCFCIVSPADCPALNSCHQLFHFLQCLSIMLKKRFKPVEMVLWSQLLKNPSKTSKVGQISRNPFLSIFMLHFGPLFSETLTFCSIVSQFQPKDMLFCTL